MTTKQYQTDKQALSAAPAEADMFWDAEDEERFGHDIDDIISDYGPGDRVKIDCAKRMPSIEVLVLADDGDLTYRIISPTPPAEQQAAHKVASGGPVKQTVREQIAAEVETQPAAQVEFLARYLCERDQVNPDQVLDYDPVKLAWHREDLNAARLLKKLSELEPQQEAQEPAPSTVEGATYHLGACIVEGVLYATVMRKEPGRAGAVTVLLSEKLPVNLLHNRDVIIDAAPQPAPAPLPLSEDQRRALKEARDTAMEWSAKGRIPESGAFGAIAQNLDWLQAETSAPQKSDAREEFERILQTKQESRFWNNYDAMLWAFIQGRAALAAQGGK